MEDEILKIMAAEIAGENVTKEEREKMNRWWEEKRGNERTYKMLMGELGEVVRLVRQQGGLDREKAYERLESDIRKKMTVRKGKIRRMRWWSFGASVAGVLLILGVGIMLWMKPEENGVWEGEKTVEPGIGQVVLTLGDGESMPLKRDTNRLIFGGTMLQVRNERGTLVYSRIKSKEASEKIVYNTLTVPVRERFQLVLADGTKVFLNSGSEMRYPERFGKARREVFLKGEAWFEVAKDSAREFWVHAGAMDVKVLGTSFNVKAYERLETVATTLVEGSVEVACAGKSFQIVPGEQFVFHSNRFIGENSYQSALKELMELSKTYKILLLPLAVTNDDYDILKKLYKDSNEIFILPSEQLTMEEIVSYLAFCDLYIGVSFHGAITAFCYGNPVVGFDFVHNKKTRDLYDQLGLSEQYVSDESMLHDGIKCAFEREQKQLKSVYKNMKQKVDMHFDEIADSLTKNNQGGYNEAFLSFSDVIDEMSGLLSVLSNQYRDRTGVIEKYKSEAQYNLLNWQKCSNEMIELYNKYQKLADEYKELKERMECKEKL